LGQQLVVVNKPGAALTIGTAASLAAPTVTISLLKNSRQRPAPWVPYCKARVHMNWRWNMDFGGGQLMDWIGHHLDIAHWDWASNTPVR
jgi:hypothetical protein